MRDDLLVEFWKEGYWKLPNFVGAKCEDFVELGLDKRGRGCQFLIFNPRTSAHSQAARLP